jgi:hypothetical protein
MHAGYAMDVNEARVAVERDERLDAGSLQRRGVVWGRRNRSSLSVKVIPVQERQRTAEEEEEHQDTNAANHAMWAEELEKDAQERQDEEDEARWGEGSKLVQLQAAARARELREHENPFRADEDFEFADDDPRLRRPQELELPDRDEKDPLVKAQHRASALAALTTGPLHVVQLLPGEGRGLLSVRQLGERQHWGRLLQEIVDREAAGGESPYEEHLNEDDQRTEVAALQVQEDETMERRRSAERRRKANNKADEEFYLAKVGFSANTGEFVDVDLNANDRGRQRGAPAPIPITRLGEVQEQMASPRWGRDPVGNILARNERIELMDFSELIQARRGGDPEAGRTHPSTVYHRQPSLSSRLWAFWSRRRILWGLLFVAVICVLIVFSAKAKSQPAAKREKMLSHT